MTTPIDSDYLTPTEIASQLTEETGSRISNRQVNQALLDLGWQKKVTGPGKKSYWRLTEKGKLYARVYRVTSVNSSWSGNQIKWSKNSLASIKLSLLEIGSR